MAKLGFRTMDEMIGRVDMLDMRDAVDHWKAQGLDLSAILYSPPVPGRVGAPLPDRAGPRLEQALDYKLIDHAREAHRDTARRSSSSCRSATSIARWARC